MDLIFNKIFLSHDTGVHVESSKRLTSLGNLRQTEIESGEKYLKLVHGQDYINQVKDACRSGGRHLGPDTVVSEASYNAACLAVGAAIQASHFNSFAVVRPPGHHAHPDRSGGFCVFNNIAITTQKLVNEGKRVLIIDIDSHLGDGTEKFFYNSDKVLYCSLHQSPAFPGGGSVDEIGEGGGRGFTVNVPLSPGSADDVFLKGTNFILNIAKQFNPDHVGVSAGFDGHHKDPLLQLHLTVNVFYQVGRLLSENFKNIFAVLEGGYNLEFLPKCFYNFLAGINKDKKPHNEDPIDSAILLLEDFNFRLEKLQKNLGSYWNI